MKRDQLDEAINVIAARMTNVEEDAALAARIANALPERSRWLPYGWLPRFAVGALATIAIIVVLRPFDEGSPVVGPAKAGHHTASVTPAEAGIAVVAPAEVGQRRVGVESAFRRTKGPQGMAVAVESPDHERSLEALDAPKALALSSLAPLDLASEEPLEVESLAIAALPLSSDFSPR